jgi:phage tail-like protein
MALTKDSRSYVAGRFALLLDGSKTCGYLKSVSGGHVSAEVVSQVGGLDNQVKKSLGNLKYNPIDGEFGMAMSKDLYDWINASWNKAYVRKNGSIVAADYDYNALTQRDFFNACISETVVPALDGSSKEPCYMKIKIDPERTKNAKASGKLAGEMGKNRNKSWLPANFRLELADLPTKKVNKIDSFTIKQTIVEDQTGEGKEYSKEPAKVEIPNIKITLAETDREQWQAWVDDFIVAGNCSETNEKTGRIVFLSPNAKELGHIDLYNCGISSLQDDSMSANSDKIKRVTAEVYVEKMVLVYSGDAVD